VVIRFRPFNLKEDRTIGGFFDIKPIENTVIVNDNNTTSNFYFDNVFDTMSTQEEIFNDIAKNAIDWVVQGYNSSIFSYGPTSSGKTFTMFGDNDNPGIIPRSCKYIFSCLKDTEFTIKCSFLEIYRDKLRDLLDVSTTSNELKIRQHATKGIYLQGIKEKLVYNPDEIMDHIKEGMNQRITSATALNTVSSRSHAILTITITQTLSDGSEMISKLNMIDLAGSENVSKSEVQGINLLEAQTINKSLSALGNVIYALTEKGREHIPYRDSKLTFLLQDSLGGNSKTIIIGTASPSKNCLSDTIETMKFIKRAKNLKNNPKVNKNESIESLLKTIESLKKRIKELEEGYEDTQKIIKTETTDTNKETQLYKTKCERYETKIKILSSEFESELERGKRVREIFDKQRELSQKTARELYKEKMKSFVINNELLQYKSMYNILKDCKPDLYESVINRTKIHQIQMNLEDEE
jgi:kinesin family protein 5